MPQAFKVAVMLDLDRGYARHIRLFAGIQAFAQEVGWDLFIDEFADETLTSTPTKRVPYDGVIARATRKLTLCAKRVSMPLVNIWHNSPCRDQLPGVFRDSALIGRLSAEHLCSRGYARFGGISTSVESHQLACESFRATVNDAGSTCTTLNISIHTYQKQKSKQRISDWLKQIEPPLGLFICADEIAYMVAQLCKKLGFRIPEDVAIIGSANEVLFCDFCRPTLSSVEPGYEQIGREAASLLQTLMTGDVPPANVVLVPPLGVIARESTDFAPVADELVAAALAFIAANGHRPIGQGDVAKAVCAEVRTLQNRFRKYLGRPIASEIRRLRIERAKRELQCSQMPTAQIAKSVGFGTSAHMCQVFQRELGLSPSAYRKKSQGNRG
jgi:LacI family transcriptional regulator